jgi:hypothetical protein
LEIAPFVAQFWFDQRTRSEVMKTKIQSKIIAIAAVAMLSIAATGGSALARGALASGGHGGGHFGVPLISTPSAPVPLLNPSSSYTVPAPTETPVSPASPGSVFH